MRLRNLLAQLRRDTAGSTAVEAALVLPALIALILGGIGGAQLAFAANSLSYAVEEAARCSAVNAALCGTHAEVEAYAEENYLGPDIEAVFVASDVGCGHTVRGAGTFQLQVLIASFDVPVTAQACYPGVDEAPP